nr:hypothetical protein [Tanacetum cinerariifolium]
MEKFKIPPHYPPVIVIDPDDQPMWSSTRTIAPTPSFAIIQRPISNNFRVKGTLFQYGGNQKEAFMLTTFPFLLSGESKTWLNELNEGTITSWNEMKEAFISQYFYLAKFKHLLNDIHSFHQLGNETLIEAWLRLKEMLRICYGHGLTKATIVHIFCPGLDGLTQGILVTRGIFLYNTPNEAFQILEDKVLLKLDFLGKAGGRQGSGEDIGSGAGSWRPTMVGRQGGEAGGEAGAAVGEGVGRRGESMCFSDFPACFQTFKTLCLLNYALMMRHDYDITSSLRRGALQGFPQLGNETLVEAWPRLKEMLRICYEHGLTKCTIVHILYLGLDGPTQGILVTGGIFLYNTPNEAFQIIEDKVLLKLDFLGVFQINPKTFVSATGNNINFNHAMLMEKFEE